MVCVLTHEPKFDIPLLRNALDGLEPAALLQPVQAQIDDLANRVRSIDLDAPLASVNAVFGWSE